MANASAGCPTTRGKDDSCPPPPPPPFARVIASMCDCQIFSRPCSRRRVRCQADGGIGTNVIGMRGAKPVRTDLGGALSAGRRGFSILRPQRKVRLLSIRLKRCVHIVFEHFRGPPGFHSRRRPYARACGEAGAATGPYPPSQERTRDIPYPAYTKPGGGGRQSRLPTRVGIGTRPRRGLAASGSWLQEWGIIPDSGARTARRNFRRVRIVQTRVAVGIRVPMPCRSFVGL